MMPIYVKKNMMPIDKEITEIAGSTLTDSTGV